MMRTALIFFALLGLLSAEIPSYVRRGHFQGRSGNVVIAPEHHRSSSGVLVLDHFRHTREGLITDINVGNLIAHLFQTAPPSNEHDSSSIDRSSFPVLSLFSAPLANVFITIQDVSSEILDQHPTLSLLQDHRRMKIQSTYQSHDPISDIETFLTSVPPAAHGIVGHSWMSSVGTETNAFVDMGAGSLADSIFDVLAMTSPNSLILSMSSNEQVAASIGVRAIDRLDAPNVISLTWNSNRQSFGSVTKHRIGSPIHANRADILNALSTRTAFVYEEMELKMDERNMQVRVSSKGGSSAIFDLNSEEDFRLFVELFFVEKAMISLKKEALSKFVSDEHPDSFALSFDSARVLRAKYGEDSPQFVAALLLIDATINSFLEDIQDLYHKRATSEVIFVAPVASSLSPETVEQVDGIVSSSVGNVKAFWPEIYVGTEGKKDVSLVDNLNDLLKAKGFSAYWFGKQQFHSQDLYLTGKGFVVKRAAVTGSGNGPVYEQKRTSQVKEFNWNVYKWFGFHFNWTGIDYTQAEVEAYQIQFWTSFFLIIITLGSCCSLCLLNPEKNNEILYRQTALGRETDTIPGGEYDFQPM